MDCWVGTVIDTFLFRDLERLGIRTVWNVVPALVGSKVLVVYTAYNLANVI
jgi:hypothetical protein